MLGSTDLTDVFNQLDSDHDPNEYFIICKYFGQYNRQLPLIICDFNFSCYLNSHSSHHFRFVFHNPMLNLTAGAKILLL
jgi:hypothetical protein